VTVRDGQIKVTSTNSDGRIKVALDSSRGDPVYDGILQAVQSKNKTKHINVSGMPDPLKAYVVASLSGETGKPAVVIVSDELRARMLQADLSAFLEGEILILRQRELSLAEVDASSRETEFGRIKTLRKLVNGDYSAVIVTTGALNSRLMPVDAFRKAPVGLRTSLRVSPEDLAMRLVGIGYERVRRVEGEGEFSRRGDIFDVFPIGSEMPVRVSFFDDEIDQIKHFELESQRSVDPLSSIEIDIAREFLISDKHRQDISRAIMAEGEKARSAAAAQGATRDVCENIMRLSAHDAERISEGIPFPGLEKWVGLVYKDSETVLSYIRSSDTLLFADEVLQIRKRADSAQADFMQRFTALLEKGQILPLSADLIVKGTDLMRELDRGGRVITLSNLPTSGNGLPGADDFSIKGRSCDSFRGHEEHLAEVITGRVKRGQQTLLMAGQGARAEKLREFLHEREAFAPIISRMLPSGFEYPAAGLLIIGTQDIFGIDRPMHRKKSQGVHIDLFSDLVPGELVVHDQHGIGRYDGIVNLQNGAVRRDYLKITYASEDTLYISMENLDSIQKYVGSEGRSPKLSRLGGQDWSRLKEKARSSIRNLAVNLVELYAKRKQLLGHAFAKDTVWQRQFEEDFPYTETQDQLVAIRDIKDDMESTRIMDRLLCGDVGFGKTEVAFRAIFKCIMDGKQAIMLAPTTVLVQQHFENLRDRLEGYPVNLGLLSRFASQTEMKKTVHGLNNGTIDVVIGTHRVLSKDISPINLGLLVVDEEQRFGVDHKEKLKALRTTVDVLTLTATPIPRTLHMSLSGIRDISVLEEPPLDRRPVQTYVMEYDADILNEACLREISRQGQVFYLFNDTHRIQEKVAELEKALPGARISMAHGKMGEHLLEHIIEGFIRHEADILVCTTIIESGIDMPNVNTLIVENADRFGLSQLYQLRGRVGRSDRQAYAYITYRRDRILTEEAEKRLAAIRDFTELGSGFKIALKDLEVRGAGNLLGGEQHGQMDVIGYELYCRMLDEEVKNLQGIDIVKTCEAVVEMDVDAYLSQDYIPDEGQRMDAYRKIGAIASHKDYMDVQDELADRYGELPTEVLVLTDIAYVRHMAGRYGFSRVIVKAETILFYYVENARPDMEALSRVLGHPYFGGKIMFSAVSKPYIQYKPSKADLGRVTERIRQFFTLLEGEEVPDEDH